MALDEANENLDNYVWEQDRIQRHKEEVGRILEQDEQDKQCVLAEERDIAQQTIPTPSPLYSPLPLFHNSTVGVIFPDRETYLTMPVAYLMGLIEGMPNNKFVSSLTRPEVTRALEILWEEWAFVMHAQKSL